MEYINLQEWKRKDHFRIFQQMDIPHINICANLDVTRFVDFVKSKKISFYYAMIFAAMHAANEIENFRYRIRNGQVVLHDAIHPAFSVLHDEDDGLFKMITADLNDQVITEFVKGCEERAEEQNAFSLNEIIQRDDLVYISCIPWISFTQLTHTTSLNKNDSVPRIAWGKYFADHNKVLVPFSVQVHHALADGVHIGRYFRELQNYIDDL